MLRRINVAILRASIWSALAGALITFVLWLRTSPELRPGFQVATWFGLSCALAFLPSLAMELGVTHLLLDLGSEEPDNDSTKSMAINDAGLARALTFGVGALSLEVTGSLFHAYVVRDVPLSLERMLRGDLLIAGLASAAILGWEALWRGARDTHRSLAWCLGFVFALFLELLNDIVPGALFSPKDAVSGVLVWSYVLLATLGASIVLRRRGVSPPSSRGAPTDRTARP